MAEAGVGEDAGVDRTALKGTEEGRSRSHPRGVVGDVVGGRNREVGGDLGHEEVALAEFDHRLGDRFVVGLVGLFGADGGHAFGDKFLEA